MDEATVEAPIIVGETPVVKRDARGRMVKGAANLNPNGRTGVKTLTAQQMIDALYEVKGPDALKTIVRKAFAMLETGNTALLAKILDKILPSKTETKTDMTVTHREEFLKMRSRAMEILESYKGRAN